MIEREQELITPQPTGQPRNFRALQRFGLVLGGWLLLVAVIQFYARAQMVQPLDLVENMVTVCQVHPASPFLFIGAAMLSPILLLPAALLGGVAGVCFGPGLGILYTLIGCNLSALLTYSMGRITGHGDNRIARLCARYGDRLQRHPFVGVLVLRLSFLPYDPINYLIGLLHIPLHSFLLANTLGSLPGVIVIVMAGSALHELGQIRPEMVLGVVAGAFISIAVVLVVRRKWRV
ncbi:MAG: DedA family protein [Chloroflexia bacterium]|nr:DedA family protein [Chloroflexia bacterium]